VAENSAVAVKPRDARISANAVVWLTSPKHALHVSYHAEFGSSALKDVSISTGEPQKLGSAFPQPPTPLEWGVADP